MINSIDATTFTNANRADPVIIFHDFLGLVAKRMKTQDIEDEIIQPFKKFDHDGDSLITVAEVQYVLNSNKTVPFFANIGSTRGAKLSEEELEDMLYICGDSNGLINYEEFVRMLMLK